MSNLSPLSNSNTATDLHIIFVHGLFGNKEDTWKNDETGFYWPKVLEDEVELKRKTKIWFYDYSIPILDGQSKILTIVDSLYKQLISESEFSTGNIIFVTHSFGGIIIKQLIRNLENNIIYDEDNTYLLNRVKGVFFLATPHTGSVYAEYVDFILDIFSDSNISKDTLPNNTYITELFRWYNKFSEKNKIIHLDFIECIPPFKNSSKFKKVFFASYVILFPGGIFFKMLLALPLNNLIDKLSKKSFPKIAGDSRMNPGINVRAISVYADHFSICKPKSKSSLVYKLIKSIISKMLNS